MAANFLASNLPANFGEAVDSVRALARVARPHAPSCMVARAKRYNPDFAAPERAPKPGSAEEDAENLRAFVKDAIEERQNHKPVSVPVCGVAMTSDADTSIVDVAQKIIDRTTRANHDVRPAWDSSWRSDMERNAGETMEQASGCLSDFAGVGMCGVKPFNNGPGKTTSAPAFGACSSRIRDMAASIQPVSEPEERKSVLRRLLEAQAGLIDPVGLIKRFEPSGGRLFVTDKERAKSTGWLASNRLLGGRAVRCLRVDPDEHYPAMRALNFEVDDTLAEPILGYFCPEEAGLYGVVQAEQRRAEVKAVLDFIHEGVVAGDNIIIHCRLGTNRSVMVALAYLMIYHRMHAQEAIELVQRRGPSRLVVRQPGFTKQLLRLEQELLHRRASVDVCSWRDMPHRWDDCLFGERPKDLTNTSHDDCRFLKDKLRSQHHVTDRVLAAVATERHAAADLGTSVYHNLKVGGSAVGDAGAGAAGVPGGPLTLLSPPKTPGTQLGAAAADRVWGGPEVDVSGGTRDAGYGGAAAGVIHGMMFKVGGGSEGQVAGVGARASGGDQASSACAGEKGRGGEGPGGEVARVLSGGGGGGGVEGAAECVSAIVDVLQNQIWNAKVLVLERQEDKVYVLALASIDQHFLDGAPLELCLSLLHATVTTDGDREMAVHFPANTHSEAVRITAESRRERDELAAATRGMVARCCAHGAAVAKEEYGVGEEEDEEGALPPPSALAARRAIKQRVQRKGRAEAPQGGGTAKDKAEAPLVLSDSDSDQEVWM